LHRDKKGGPIRNRRGVGTGSGFGPAAVWKEKFQAVLAEKNKVRLSSQSMNYSHDAQILSRCLRRKDCSRCWPG
jgi:hypothetical protein